MKRTPLQIAFDNFAGRPNCRNAKHIDLWQVFGETIYHASVEQHTATGLTPEDAIMQATRDYLSHCESPRKVEPITPEHRR